MFFLVFVRDGRKVHGGHVDDGKHTLAAQSEAVVAGMEADSV